MTLKNMKFEKENKGEIKNIELPSAPKEKIEPKIKGKAVLISWINNINAELAGRASSHTLCKLQSCEIHLTGYNRLKGKSGVQEELRECWYSCGLRITRRRDAVLTKKRIAVLAFLYQVY